MSDFDIDQTEFNNYLTKLLQVIQNIFKDQEEYQVCGNNIKLVKAVNSHKTAFSKYQRCFQKAKPAVKSKMAETFNNLYKGKSDLIVKDITEKESLNWLQKGTLEIIFSETPRISLYLSDIFRLAAATKKKAGKKLKIEKHDNEWDDEKYEEQLTSCKAIYHCDYFLLYLYNIWHNIEPNDDKQQRLLINLGVLEEGLDVNEAGLGLPGLSGLSDFGDIAGNIGNIAGTVYEGMKNNGILPSTSEGGPTAENVANMVNGVMKGGLENVMNNVVQVLQNSNDLNEGIQKTMQTLSSDESKQALTNTFNNLNISMEQSSKTEDDSDTNISDKLKIDDGVIVPDVDSIVPDVDSIVTDVDSIVVDDDSIVIE